MGYINKNNIRFYKLYVFRTNSGHWWINKFIAWGWVYWLILQNLTDPDKHNLIEDMDINTLYFGRTYGATKSVFGLHIMDALPKEWPIKQYYKCLRELLSRVFRRHGISVL